MPEVEGLPGEEDDPDRERQAVPHPLDRVWRHPSELPAVARSKRRGRRRRQAEGVGRTPAWLVAGVAGLAGSLATVGLLGAFGVLNRRAPGEGSTGPIVAGQERKAGSTGTRSLAAHVAPAIVAIVARDGNGSRRGTGVALRHAGEVVTSNRLVGTASTVAVVVADGTVYQASVVGHDRVTDLALLRTDHDIAAAPISARTVRSGDSVVVVSANADAERSVWMSAGIVSSVDALASAVGGPMMRGLVEADARAESSSAGGALIDTRGDVAGIVLGAIGDHLTTLAVPISLATDIADRLRRDGRVEHGWLGVEAGDGPAGPTVSRIAAGGPAAGKDLAVGDVVRSVDGRPVETMGEVMACVRSRWPGEKVLLELARGSRTVRATVTLASDAAATGTATAAVQAPATTAATAAATTAASSP